MILILVLSTLSSGTDFVVAESAPENFKPTPKIFTINLTEEIGVKETKKQSEKYKQYNVSLIEKIGVISGSSSEELALIKHDSDRKIIMERIFDRQFKLKINESNLLKISSPSILSYYEQDIDDDLIYEDSDLSINKSYFGINNLIPNIFESEIIISNFIRIDQNIFDEINIEYLNDQLFDPKNPILLILLIPFAGFVLIRYDNDQIKFYQVKQFFTLIFVVILVSSTVITPMSISSYYWGGYAFAEIDNSTEIISQLESAENILQNNVTNILQNNSTNILESNNDFSEINFSEIISPNFYSIKPNNEISISDILSVTLSKFTGITTSSDVSDSLTTDSNMSISDILSVTLSKFTGTTTSSDVSDSLTLIQACPSLTF